MITFLLVLVLVFMVACVYQGDNHGGCIEDLQERVANLEEILGE